MDNKPREDLMSPKPGWRYGVSDAALMDRAHVLAYAKVLASEARLSMEFMRYYTGPTLSTPSGKIFGGTRFPQGGPTVILSGGRPAVEAVLKACGYPITGL